MAGLSTSEIECALRSRCETAPHFIGCFALDTLPREYIIHRPALVVCNTAFSGSGGEHWVAFYLDGHGVSYFDSYGLPLSNPYFIDFINVNSNKNSVRANYAQLQSLTSNVCGKYVCVYLFYRVLGYSHNHVIQVFRQSPDAIVCLLFRNIFGRVRGCRGAEQTCYKYTL